MLHVERLNLTESPIFVILCVCVFFFFFFCFCFCFQRQSFVLLLFESSKALEPDKLHPRVVKELENVGMSTCRSVAKFGYSVSEKCESCTSFML